MIDELGRVVPDYALSTLVLKIIVAEGQEGKRDHLGKFLKCFGEDRSGLGLQDSEVSFGEDV